MGSADEPEAKPKTMHKLKCKITNKAKSLFTKNKTKSETNTEQKPDGLVTRAALMDDKREPKMKSLTPTGISDSLEKTKMILLEKKQQQSLDKKETAPDSPKSDQFIIQRVPRKKVESDSFDDDDEFVFMDVKPKTNSQCSTDSGFGGASFDKDDNFEVVKEEKSSELAAVDEKANSLFKDGEKSNQLIEYAEKSIQFLKDGEKSVKDDKKSKDAVENAKEHVAKDERTKGNVTDEKSVDPLTESLNKLEISTDETEKSVTDSLKKLTIDVDKVKEEEKGDKKKKHTKPVLITRGPVRSKDFKTPTGPYSQQINQVNEKIFSGGHVTVKETHPTDAKGSIYQLEQPALPTFLAGAAPHALRFACPLDEAQPQLNATGLTNKEVEDCMNQVFAVLPNEVIDTLLESQPALQTNPTFDDQWTAHNQQVIGSNLMSLYEAELNAQNPSPQSIQSYSSSPPQILAHEISHDFLNRDFMPALSGSPAYAKSPPADFLNDYGQQIINASPSYSTSSQSNDGLSARVFDGLTNFDGAHGFDNAFDGTHNVFKDFNSQHAMLSEDFLLAFNHNSLGADMLTPPRSNDSHYPSSPFASPKYAESYSHSSPRSDDFVMSPGNRLTHEQTYTFANTSPEHDRTTPTIKLTDAVKIDDESDVDDSKLKRRTPINMSMFKKHMQVLAARYAAMQCCQKDRKHPKDAFVERLDRCSKEKRIQMTLRVGKLNIDQLFNLLYFRVLPALECVPNPATDDVDYALVALICQRLLAEKPDLFLDEDFGLALLSRAAMRCASRPEITRYFVWCARRALACAPTTAARAGAVFTQTDITGDNIAGALARLGDTHADCLAELVARDPRDRPLLDLEHRNTEGYSALHLACQLHNALTGPRTTHIVHILLAHGGVPVTLPDNKAGDTALHCAVDAGGCDLDLVLTLFQDVPANKRRALAYCKNAGTKTPIELARSASRTRADYPVEVLEFLKKCRT